MCVSLLSCHSLGINRRPLATLSVECRTSGGGAGAVVSCRWLGNSRSHFSVALYHVITIGVYFHAIDANRRRADIVAELRRRKDDESVHRKRRRAAIQTQLIDNAPRSEYQ